MAGSDKEDDAEKRIQRAMDRLFQAASSSSPPKRARDVGTVENLSPFVLSGSPPEKNAALTPSTSSAPSCRPWDRDDLFRRLATFKSISWFGKPSVATPVACARRGWVNVDLDMISCEVCGSRLSFSFPDNWTKQQVEKAGSTFSAKLDSAHKPLCPWKGNACAEELAAFAPTPAPDLIQGYDERLQSLSTLSAVPIISSSAIEHMKLTRGPQLNYLLSPSSENPRFENFEAAEGEAVQKLREKYESFCQAEKLISLCGWEVRHLPYAVDNHEDVQENGPKVSLNSKGLTVHGDPSSVVLECGLCNASVGLWRYQTWSRSSMSISAILAAIQASAPKVDENKPEGSEKNTVPDNCTSGNGDNGEEENNRKEEQPIKPAGLDLNLTVAGGPRPTRISYPPGIFPAYIPIPGLFSQNDCESRKVTTVQESGEQVNSNVGTSKRKRDGDQGQRKKSKGVRVQIQGCSSVNAVETSYMNKHENSAESVECSPHESDEQGTVHSRESNEDGLVTQESVVHAVVEPQAKDPVLFTGSATEFDPVHQHRYFCPWITSNTGEAGWQMTVDALYAARNQTLGTNGTNNTETTSLTRKADPIASVRKMLGGKGKSVASTPVSTPT